MKNVTDFVGVDLFAGAGGMSLAATLAGVRIIHAVEKCPFATASYRLNFPDVPATADDIRRVDKLPTVSRESRKILFGGPPCQGFSTSNQRTRDARNPNNWMFREFLRLTKSWKPDWVVMENVKGILETEGGRFLESATKGLRAAGYTTNFQALNAADFGVPQRRTRVFIVGSLHAERFEFPEGLSTASVTVREAIGDLPELSNGANADRLRYGVSSPSSYARSLRGRRAFVSGNLVTTNSDKVIARYRHVPPGGNWSDIPRRLMRNYSDVDGCHTGIYHRLDPERPSVVIGNFRKNMLIHPLEDRGLSVREAARLQSIPDSFRFSGSIGFQQQQVGNMVPPLLGTAIFQQVVAS